MQTTSTTPLADILAALAPGTPIVVHVGLTQGNGAETGQPVPETLAAGFLQWARHTLSAVAWIRGQSDSPWGAEPALWVSGTVPEEPLRLVLGLPVWRAVLAQKAIGITTGGSYQEGA